MLARGNWAIRAVGCGAIVCLSRIILAEETPTEAQPTAKTAPIERAVQLKYKFQPGQFVNYEVSDHVRYVMQQAGKSFETFQRNDSSKHFRVVSVDEEGSAILEPIIDRIKMSKGRREADENDGSKLHDQTLVEFDSAKDKVAPSEFQRHKETIGKPMARFQFASHGKLLSVRLIDNNVPKAMTAAADKADPKLNFLVPLPTEPISIGHRWKQKYDEPISVGQGLTQQIPMLRQYELLSISDGIATIKFKTSILALLNEPKIQGQLAQQTPSGTIEFDIERGLIRSKKSITNETVVNALGQQTVLQVIGESTEKLVQNESAIQQVGFTKEADSSDK
jgi:hypothetical protein